MDWTGGVRRRFAPGKNNATLQKQKAHFAKARAALLHPSGSQHTSSFRPDGDHKKALVSILHRVKPLDHPLRRHGQYIEREMERDTSSRKKTPKNRSPSIISITSDERSSSLRETVLQRGAPGRTPSLHHDTERTAEERLLLTNRRRLLARSDWLGLAALRPVQMRYASSHDRDRIGKRRKIETTAPQRSKAAQKRLLTPLFEQRFQPNLKMSGALQSQDIVIKLGTEALASQTQRTHRSRTPIATSMRQPSTDFDLGSEESMLLGADGETFEPTFLREETFLSAQLEPINSNSLGALTGSPLLRANRFDLSGPEQGDHHHVSLSPADREYTQHSPNPGGDSDVYGIIPDSECGQRLEALPRSIDRTDGFSHDAPDRNTLSLNEGELERFVPQMHETRVEHDDFDEETWRMLMKINYPASSCNSRAALRSSSMHVTTSESDHHQVRLEDIARARNERSYHASIVEAAGLANSRAHNSQKAVQAVDPEESSTSVASPSASLQQITRFAEQPAPLAELRGEVEAAEDDALWRQFIIGSEDSNESSQDLVGELRFAADDDNEIAPTALSSSNFALSGLGTSNKSTLGDTQFAAGSSSSQAMATIPSKRKAELLSSLSLQNSRKVDTYTMAQRDEQDERDSIEDVQPPVSDESQSGNIHTAATSILNPKRFKRPKKQEAELARRSSHILPSRKPKRRNARTQNSI